MTPPRSSPRWEPSDPLALRAALADPAARYAEVAARWGCVAATLRQWRRRQGIPDRPGRAPRGSPRRTWAPADPARALAGYRAGLSLGQLAASEGTPRTTFALWLRRVGEPRRALRAIPAPPPEKPALRGLDRCRCGRTKTAAAAECLWCLEQPFPVEVVRRDRILSRARSST